MVLVESSMGRSKNQFVRVEVLGVAEVMRQLNAAGKLIEQGADRGLARAATYVKDELQESIMGDRDEVKSVDTGQFANSITVDKNDDGSYKIFPDGEYPNGTSVEDVAKFLEYGTDRIQERRHFRNTKDRTESRVVEIVASEL